MKVSGRSLLVAVVFVLSVANSFIGTNAQLNNPVPSFGFILPNFTFHYNDMGFLRTPLIREFCAPVPNVPGMKMVQPKDFVDEFGHSTNGTTPCDQGEFVGAVILSILGSLIPLLGIIFCLCLCPCICFARYKFGYFGGDTRTPIEGAQGLILPGDETAGIKRGYHQKDVNMVKSSYLLIFGFIMIGSLFVVASTQMISTFIHDTNQIFADYTDFNVYTVDYIRSEIYSLSTSTSDRAVVDQAQSIANGYQHSRETEISNALTGLAGFVEAIMYLTVGLVFFVLILGVLAGWVHIPKFAIILALVLMFLLALVWIDFTVAYAASNILSKMCDSINNCHFCYEGQIPGCDGSGCRHPWFQTMRSCTPEYSNRYSNLSTLLMGKASSLADQTCASINTLCGTAGYKCVTRGPGNCNSSTILADGLQTWVTLDSGATRTIPELTKVTPLAANVMLNFGQMQMFTNMWQQLSTLDCDSGLAYIESTPGPGLGYHGTYDRLQEQLCPAMGHPQWSVFQMIHFLAVGLIIMGVFIPCAQVCLCLGDKRWRRNATVAPMLTGDYESREINSIEVKPIRSTSIFERD